MNVDLLKRIVDANGRTLYAELEKHLTDHAEQIIASLTSTQSLPKIILPEIEPAPVFKSAVR